MNKLSERVLLLLLAAVQFTHIVDFMILMPLGPQLMRDLNIGPGAFSGLVAAYTISSGVVGLLVAPFIDRFDRRKVLLVAYGGFIGGTLTCALSRDVSSLFVARAVSGAFGGIATSMVMAIIGDVVPAQRRGSAMGIVMTSFSVAAAVGVPFGLKLAQAFRWEIPFFVLSVLAAGAWMVAFSWLPSIRGHVGEASSGRPFAALLRDANGGRALAFMVATVFGHFAIIPLLSPFLVQNVGLSEDNLFLVYMTGGLLTVFTGPLVGRLSDRLGRFRVFTGLVVVACGVTLFITHSPRLPTWAVLFSGGAFFVFASGRFIPGQAIMTLAVPASRRGAFMSLSGCARDLAMGAASTLGGWIVITLPSGELAHYGWLGWIAVAAALVSVWLGKGVQVHDRIEPAPAR